jgi:predicted phosphodiesterase
MPTFHGVAVVEKGSVMRLALVSDIHGNFEALRAVLADIRQVGVDQIVCLGDTVGYGPDPGACLDLVAEWADAEVLGNHDLAAYRSGHEVAFADTARASLSHTRTLLKPRHLQRLQSIPERDRVGGVMLAHASFAGRFEYLYTKAAALRSLRGLAGSDAMIGAVGHTHLPSIFAVPIDSALLGANAAAEAQRGGADQDVLAGGRDGGAGGDGGALDDVLAWRVSTDQSVRLPEGMRVIVNPGSVGQPRDRNPMASWGVLDLQRRTFTVRRVAYDINEVNLRMQALGLPEFLGERLRVGV